MSGFWCQFHRFCRYIQYTRFKAAAYTLHTLRVNLHENGSSICMTSLLEWLEALEVSLVTLRKLSHKFYIWSISAKPHQSMIQIIVLYTVLRHCKSYKIAKYRAHKEFITVKVIKVVMKVERLKRPNCWNKQKYIHSMPIEFIVIKKFKIMISQIFSWLSFSVCKSRCASTHAVVGGCHRYVTFETRRAT